MAMGLPRLAGWIRARQEDRSRREATADLWAEASTLAELGELTARWLEGELAFHPGGYDVPDEETTELVPALAVLNRAGFVTWGSQPGEEGTGHDGAWWRQRAAVDGFATAAATQALVAAAQAHRFQVIVHTPGVRLRDARMTVTTRNGRLCTEFGAWLPPRYIRLTYGAYCNHDAVAALNAAHQVTVIDPRWACNDDLWPALTHALRPTDKPSETEAAR